MTGAFSVTPGGQNDLRVGELGLRAGRHGGRGGGRGQRYGERDTDHRRRHGCRPSFIELRRAQREAGVGDGLVALGADHLGGFQQAGQQIAVAGHHALAQAGRIRIAQLEDVVLGLHPLGDGGADGHIVGLALGRDLGAIGLQAGVDLAAAQVHVRAVLLDVRPAALRQLGASLGVADGLRVRASCSQAHRPAASTIPTPFMDFSRSRERRRYRCNR